MATPPTAEPIPATTPVGLSAALAARFGRWLPISTRSHSVLTSGLRLPWTTSLKSVIAAWPPARTGAPARRAVGSVSSLSTTAHEVENVLRIRSRQLAQQPPALRASLDQQLDELLHERMIEPVPLAQQCSGLYSPIFIIDQSTPQRVKHRLIHDLRDANASLSVPTFHMEAMSTVADHVRHGWFGATCDISHAFGAIPVAYRDRAALRFVDARGRHFQWRTLPFGLACSPLEWTRLLRGPITQLRRDQGITILSFMDDCVILAPTEAECAAHLETTLRLFASLGLRVAPEKTQAPAQIVHYLGWQINTLTMTVDVPLAKLESLQRACRLFLSLKPRKTTLRAALRMLGTARSMLLAAPHVLPNTRTLATWAAGMARQRLLAPPSRRASLLDQGTGPWPIDVRTEINTLLVATTQALDQSRASGSPTWTQPIVPDPALAHHSKDLALAGWSVARVISDASNSGYGATASFYPSSRAQLDTPAATMETAAQWPSTTVDELAQPSIASTINLKELWAAAATASALLPLIVPQPLRSTSIVVFSTDNTTARAYLARKCGRFGHLTRVAQMLVTWAARNGFTPSLLLSHHLPGDQNTTADALSRLPHHHEIMLHPQIMQATVAQLGATPPQLDLFASEQCHQPSCPTFMTRWPSSQLHGRARTTHMDALHERLDWSTLPPTWCFPPTPLVPRVLRRLHATPPQQDFVLVVPWWPGASWWPLLRSLPSLRRLQPIDTTSPPPGQSALQSASPQTDSPPRMPPQRYGAALLRA